MTEQLNKRWSESGPDRACGFVGTEAKISDDGPGSLK